MVKVQKLNVNTAGKPEKAKKKNKSSPSKDIGKESSKKMKGAVAALEKAPKQIKQKLVKAAAKDVAIVAPTKKEKLKLQKNAAAQKMPVQKQEPVKAAKQSKKKLAAPKQTKQQEKSAAKRGPMVLAPTASPAPPPKSTKAAAAVATTQKKKKPFGKKTDPPAQLKKKEKQKANNGAAAASGAQRTDKPLTKAEKKKATKRAFKKAQLKKKRSGVEKKTAKTPSKQFEAPPFDEDKFSAIVNEQNIQKIAKALKEQVAKEVTTKKTGIFDDYHYILNVCCFKIASCPKRIVKLNLKHSLVDKDDDVAIVVADLQRGAKVDYEPTIQHYEDLFREAGVEGLKIVPFNQLRNECTTFETVRKFGNTYDYFLCDGRLVAHVAGFCGKVFQKPRTTFHAVRMDNHNNLKKEIEKSLRRTAYRQLSKGDLISIPIGNHKYTEQQVAENAAYVVEQLKTLYPGGLGNIRGMHLKIDMTGTSSLPIYLSMAQAPEETPYVVGPREKRLLKMRKDANEVLTKFNLTKDGGFVRLSKREVDQKNKLKELRAAIAADNADGEESVVPAKKAKTDKDVAKEETGMKGGKEKQKANKKNEEEQEDELDEVEGNEEDEDGDEHDDDDDGEGDDGEDEDDEDDDGDDDDDDDDDDGDEEEDDDDDEGGDDAEGANEDSSDSDEE